MKKAFLLLVISSSSIITIGQEISFSIAPTLNSGFHFRFVYGGPNYATKTGFSTTLDYTFANQNRIKFGMGFTYQLSRVEVQPPTYLIGRFPHNETINLISASFKSTLPLKNNKYLSFDPLLTFQLKSKTQQSVDDQTGLGLSFAFGKKFFMNKKVFLAIEPRIWVHHIIPFIDQNLPLRLTSLGLNMKLGFLY
ncbi:MAG: hypothetical protein HQ541_01145 [Mariniphaga sp.]|nr:hypothetical protein [Mariniphaga sp.]